MPTTNRPDLTAALAGLREGDESAMDRIMPIVYDELRALAGAMFRAQRADHTLQPTALVHEAFLRLVAQTSPDFKDRTHFFNVAAMAMRQLLADHARRRRSLKRGGDFERVTLEAVSDDASSTDLDIVALDDALARLEELDPRQSRIVELRFLAGLPVEDVATVLGITSRTVRRDWQMARAWLRQQLAGPDE